MSSFKSTSALMQKISTENLAYIVKNQQLLKEKDPKKKDMVKVITEEVEDLGLFSVTSMFSKVQLEEYCKSMATEDEEKVAQSKTVLRKKLQRAMKAAGVSEFLTENMEDDVIVDMIETLGEKAVKGKEERIDQLSVLIQRSGTEVFLSKFETGKLKAIMEDLGLECSTLSKNAIIQAITDQTDALAQEPVAKTVTYSKTKKPLKQGIEYQDVFQHYYVEELQEWARDNGLKVSGTKKILINRILSFLDGDKENTMATPKKATPKKSASPKTSRKETTKPEKKTTEKEVKETEEEDETEEAQEEEIEEKVEAESKETAEAAKESPKTAKKDTKNKKK